MNNVTSFDRPTLRVIDADIQAALNTVASKYGISIKLKGGSFSATTCNTKIELLSASHGVKGADPIRDAAEARAAVILGLPQDIVGKTFDQPRIGGGVTTFTVTKLDLKKPKYPVIATSSRDGKSYKFTEDSVKRLLK